MTRIVLAYSAGLAPRPDAASLDEAAGRGAIGWLAAHHSAEVVTVTLDFGRGRELEAVRDSALAAGAVRAHVLDVAALFSSRFVLPTLRAGALYAENGVATTTGLGRALIAQKLVEIAGIEQATTVAHGCGADDGRVAASVRVLDPRLAVVAVPAGTSDASASVMGPRLPFQGEPPGEAASLELTFARGTPSSINGIAMPLVDLIGSVDMIAGAHRVGRFNHLETPAIAVLHAAHGGLQQGIKSKAARGAAPPDRAAMARRYVDLIEGGRWFSADREALDAEIDRLESAVNGSVRVTLLKGECRLGEPRVEKSKRASEVM
jgi:argininosuccinate synthase